MNAPLLYLIGGGGFAGEIVDAILSTVEAPRTLAGLFDDDTRLKGKLTHGLNYLGTIGDFASDFPEHSQFVTAIGDNLARERVANILVQAGKQPIAVIHARACVSARAVVEPGAYVAANAFVGPRSYLGRFSLVNVGSSVGHDSKIEAYAQLCPGVRVSGYCQVGVRAFLGSNSGIAPSVNVGPDAKLAAGSFAFRDVPPSKLAVGCPAKLVS